MFKMKVIFHSYVTIMLVYQRVGWGDEGAGRKQENMWVHTYIYIYDFSTIEYLYN